MYLAALDKNVKSGKDSNEHVALPPQMLHGQSLTRSCDSEDQSRNTLSAISMSLLHAIGGSKINTESYSTMPEV